MPVRRNDHQAQLFATPFSRIRLVTRLGVSVLKVVATIETPISHHGAARPEVKNSAVLDPARRASSTAGMNEMMIEATTMAQSSRVGCTDDSGREEEPPDDYTWVASQSLACSTVSNSGRSRLAT